ncbi:hypothetical protein M9Y10_003061 [Tritrichomonas musculus]|uniref:SAM-dependent MTase RsmB/NOP-type domain-containing protein n=1 Tax=Tritrichomonas musculus TaxID=1915356 RepID=A0ABR2JNU5_9EUKA
MTYNDFEQLIHESNQISTFFYITAQDKQKERIRLNFRYFQPKLEQDQARIKAYQIFDGEKIINVVYTNNSDTVSQYIKWLNENTSKGFIGRMKFSSLIPFLFLKVNFDDTLFCQGTIDPAVIKIVSKILSNGYIFVNEPDIKKGKENYDFGSDNLCVLHYKELSAVPRIQLFDKVVCFAPSSEDGLLYDFPSEWSIDNASRFHSIQKEYLKSSLNKLKGSGICVYSTYSINPIENEAVVNEVLNEMNGEFSIVDCSNMINDINRFQGLTDWEIEGFDCKTKNAKNINFCMRFYSHLIHSDSTFVAVVKRKETEYNNDDHNQAENDEKNDFIEKNVFKKVPQNIIDKIIGEFGFDKSEFETISFFHSDMFKKTIFNVSEKLGAVIGKENKNLKICHLGSSAFFFNKEDFNSIPVPLYDCFLQKAKFPSKRLIRIDFVSFEKLVKLLSISIEELSDQDKNNLKSIEDGGIFMKIENCNYMFGTYLNNNLVKLEMTSLKARQMLEKVNDLRLFQEVGIGYSDFYEIRKNNYFYVDKTEFISEWWGKGPLSTLITRPRRFGKSLTMSMVKYFFSTEYANEKEILFKGTKIWKDKEMMEIQGTYPVISMNFGKCKFQDVDNILYAIKQEIASAIITFKNILLSSNKLNEDEVKIIKSISYEMNDNIAVEAIHQICLLFYRIYNKKMIILLDEYDAPMIKFWEKSDEAGWQKLITFLGSFFCSTFKENEFLQRALITGITPICKESIFSGFNNLQVVTTSSYQYSSIFGFTYHEVYEALKNYGLGFWEEKIMMLYDGYCFGSTTHIFNPWSITKFLNELQEPDCYWINTSDNSLIEDLVRKCSPAFCTSLVNLLQNHEFCISIQEEDISFNDIYNMKLEAIISLLVASGYLSIIGKVTKGRISNSILTIPNFEIQLMFKRIISAWFDKSESFSDFIMNFIQCNIESLNKNLNQILLDCIGTFDSVECFLNGLCLGMLIELRDRFDILSNRQSGKGRSGVIFIPKDIKKDNKGYIIEFKYRSKQNCVKETKDVLLELAQGALQQIDGKCYYQDLTKKGVEQSNIIKYAMVFYDLECLVTIKEIESRYYKK